MRLRKIRLAGFKSFVDPTTITFPGNLIGVVGPNGCGKSNVIDAVRWVMGELSAKHLRGDSMADVVFTGSNSRKPVGQASVELVFDNADGSAGGRYASYAEISIKRQVSRDAQSVYFINGARCRRRDVTDIFLGTGLGPRSYAIIEQGMISRLIEAKPEELREFLEEAAGISKYKERRRETETRIRHTRENLERLDDIREELAKRLTHLKRQATMAEKFKVLKAEERHLRAQLLAIRWRGFDEEMRRQRDRVTAQELASESARSDQRRAEAAVESQRVRHNETTEAFNAVYREVLDAGAAIARREEAIQGLRQQREQLRDARASEQASLASARGNLADDEQRLAELRRSLAESEPEHEQRQREATEARLGLREREEAMQAWQGEWESLTQRAAEPARAAHAEETRIQQLERNLVQYREREERLAEERRALDARSEETAIAALEEQLTGEESALEEWQSSALARQREIGTLRIDASEGAERLHSARERFQQARGRLASLEALQEEALGKATGPVVAWLRERAIDGRPRLGQVLRAQAGWEQAVEIVLGARLEAVCVEDVDVFLGDIDGLDEGRVALVAEHAPGAALGDDGHSRLSDLVEAPGPVLALLAGVRAAPDVDAALAMRGTLGPGDSVVTPSGLWIGSGWAQVARGGEESGVLRREQTLESLGGEVRAMESDARAVESALNDTTERMHAAEDALAEAQDVLADGHRRIAALRSEFGALQAKQQERRTRLASLSADAADLAARREAEQRLLASARERLATTSEELARINDERDAWERRRDEHRGQLEAARNRWQGAREAAYDVGLRLESMRAQATSLEEARARVGEHVARLERRVGELDETLAGTEAPLRDATAALDGELGARSALDDKLARARTGAEEAEGAVRELDEQRYAHEQRAALERETLERLRMEAQETAVRRTTVEEQAGAEGHELAALLESLPNDAGEASWEEQLETMARRINRLGPINLAAIEEHEQEAERKTYLDSQHADLEEALTTLVDAIGKIDRETRSRFKETYEKVNAGLSVLFPRLFGGGQAALELTGDDLLSTGINVVARPPGKRNTTIHLLSGGEKALTAVALVFAIFELNPAPFCLLDEVDAPLDDSNVQRFGELVKEMSERVQLVVVTHNKLTMELAHQLIGVTMNEPGVSRLVAVDLDEAVELAAV